ncbi:hypothetical protein UFOVP1319_42 [uncultured Caudovirales phage]|uniref:Uncharacterized protein n=3 Tax=uncultured Caudovirales phage TaxID=2100421 RepID=A0A6J5MRX8_9CAUD|nr:hypothetical protein UFOVP478_25 [uncultured Caudovirales phage]CAB4197937.1 hypothetical protein UFOVP1319_42 [uncultured Caudovirales phage]
MGWGMVQTTPPPLWGDPPRHLPTYRLALFEGEACYRMRGLKWAGGGCLSEETLEFRFRLGFHAGNVLGTLVQDLLSVRMVVNEELF